MLWIISVSILMQLDYIYFTGDGINKGKSNLELSRTMKINENQDSTSLDDYVARISKDSRHAWKYIESIIILIILTHRYIYFCHN